MQRGQDLYTSVKEHERGWLHSNVQKVVTNSISATLVRAQTQNVPELLDQSNERRAAGEKFLAVLKEAWEDHQLCMAMITDVMMYMVSSQGTITLKYQRC